MITNPTPSEVDAGTPESDSPCHTIGKFVLATVLGLLGGPAVLLSAAPSGDEKDAHWPAIPVRMVTPEYPRQALHQQLGGYAEVCFTITAGGRVTDAQVTDSSHQLFDRAALKAAKNSSFKPAHRNQQAVASPYCRTYRFRLHKRR